MKKYLTALIFGALALHLAIEPIWASTIPIVGDILLPPTPTSVPVETPTPSPTSTQIEPTPTQLAEPMPTTTNPTPTQSETITPTVSPTVSLTITPSIAITPTFSPTPSLQATPSAMVTPTRKPSKSPTPTASPTQAAVGGTGDTDSSGDTSNSDSSAESSNSNTNQTVSEEAKSNAVVNKVVEASKQVFDDNTLDAIGDTYNALIVPPVQRIFGGVPQGVFKDYELSENVTVGILLAATLSFLTGIVLVVDNLRFNLLKWLQRILRPFFLPSERYFN